MIQYLDSVYYLTLSELNETYKQNNPDVLRLRKKYGDSVKFSRIMYPENHVPRFKMVCYYIVDAFGS